MRSSSWGLLQACRGEEPQRSRLSGKPLLLRPACAPRASGNPSPQDCSPMRAMHVHSLAGTSGASNVLKFHVPPIGAGGMVVAEVCDLPRPCHRLWGIACLGSLQRAQNSRLAPGPAGRCWQELWGFSRASGSVGRARQAVPCPRHGELWPPYPAPCMPPAGGARGLWMCCLLYCPWSFFDPGRCGRPRIFLVCRSAGQSTDKLNLWHPF